MGFSDCTFVQWDGKKLGRPAIHAVGGTLLVRGCDFREDKRHVEIEKGVKRAIVTDCVAPKALQIKCADPSILKVN